MENSASTHEITNISISIQIYEGDKFMSLFLEELKLTIRKRTLLKTEIIQPFNTQQYKNYKSIKEN